jgi:fructoselysine-6-P-deglycase FrlB-like protein
MTATLGSAMERELRTQPDTWRRAAELAARTEGLPARGERVAVIGCGTSWFMADAYAVLRERAGHGPTDAYAASEARLDRDYDRVVAITRSGTTSEVLEAIEGLGGRIPTLGIVGDTGSPFVHSVDALVALPFADEESVVQTRFATTALTFLRASVGEPVDAAIADAERALELPLPGAAVTAEQLTFLGTGFSVGLAHEAALKNREASQSWTESYPAMDYRHGPIAIARAGRATWMLGEPPAGLADQVRSLGADWVHEGLDPLAELVLCQRVALERARRAGLDADAPRGLSRSVILEDE